MLKKTKFKVPKCDKNISKMFEKYEKKRIKIYKTDHVHIIYNPPEKIFEGGV